MRGSRIYSGHAGAFSGCTPLKGLIASGVATRTSAVWGRTRELDQLAATLDRAQNGVAAVALVTGEPGIGKTRLLEEVEVLGRERGFAVGWGRAFELGGAPTYWPWIEVLRELLARTREHDAAADRMVALLPELSAGAVVARRAASLDSFALCDAVCGYLRAHCSREPLLIVLDDLHAADPSSLELALFLARVLRGAPCVLLGSHRDVEARLSPQLDRALCELARHADVFVLPRLGLAEVAALVREELGQERPEEARLIHEASAGNPLFARELARLRATGGRSSSGVPAGVRAVIRQRLALLDPRTIELLQVAAVLGREFSLTIAAELAGVTLTTIEQAVIEGARADLLATSGPARIAFSHALVVETLVAELPTLLGMQLQARAAEALAAARTRDPLAASLEEIAHHYRQAGAGWAAQAFDASEQAARVAFARLAFADAAVGFTHALASLQLAAPDDVQRRARLLVLQTESYCRSGDRGHAQSSCEVAVELAHAQGDSELLAQAALALGAEPRVGERDADLVRLLTVALAALPQADGEWRARVMARLASARQPEPDPEPPMALARDAIAMARRLGGQEVLLNVLHSALGALVDYAPAAERAALNSEAALLSDAADDQPRGLRARTRLMFDYLELCDMAGFERTLVEYDALAARGSQPRHLWVGRMFHAMRASLQGLFAQADAIEVEARALYAQARGDGPVCLPGRKLALALLREDPLALDSSLAEFDPGMGLDPVLRQAVAAEMLARRARLEEAAQLFMPLPLDKLVTCDPHVLDALSDLAARLQSRELAAVLYPRLLPRAGQAFVITGIAYCVHGIVDHALLRLAALLDQPQACDRHAQSALELCARLAARPIEVRVRRDYGRVLLTRAPPEPARGREHLEQAHALANTLGMHSVADECRAVLAGARETAEGLRLEQDMAVQLQPARQETQVQLAIEQEGEYWTIRRHGVICRVRDSRGMRMLAQLINAQGRELHVLELSGAFAPVDRGDAGPALDARAREAYRVRLRELQFELDEAEAQHDAATCARLTNEIEQLQAAITQAFGLGGRARSAGSAVERARVNVQRRIAHALAHIDKAHPELGRHLHARIKTGIFCVYEP